MLSGNIVRLRAARQKHGVNVVFDWQEEFSERAVGLFKDIQSLGDPQFNRLKTLSFSRKDEMAALQAADIVTYEVYRFFENDRTRWQLKEIQEAIPIKGRFWNSEALAELASEQERLRKERSSAAF